MTDTLRAALADCCTRMEVARGILQEDTGGSWGMLDTEKARAALAEPAAEPVSASADERDAERYRWLRACLWTQELNQWSKGKAWVWSTRFAACVNASGDLDPVTQGQELDAAIDARMAEDPALSAQQAPAKESP